MLLSFRATDTPSVFETHRVTRYCNQLVLVGVGLGDCTPEGIVLDADGERAFDALLRHERGQMPTDISDVIFVPVKATGRVRDTLDRALDCCAGPFALLYFVCQDAATQAGLVSALGVQSSPAPISPS